MHFGIAKAQDISFLYIPKNKDSILNYINKVNENKKAKLNTKHNKEIKKIIAERNVNFIKNINDSTYIFDPRISKYLNKILAEIYQSNSEINNKDSYFFINKSPIPNASCYGNGIFTVNLGLFGLMQNDDELAYILCHEIAHSILEHNDKSLLSYVEKYNSKDVKHKIRDVNRQEFGKRKAISLLIKDLNYNFLRHSRKAESQADSLGLVLFSKTKYKKSASIDALKRLDFVDDRIFNDDINLKNHFDFSEYPFKEAWLTKEETLFDLKESSSDYSLDKDSIKTHPGISIRIDELQKLLKSDTKTTLEFSEIQLIKKIVSDNSIAIFLNDLKLDFALYQTLLKYDQKQLDEQTYCNTVSLILKKTYELKKNHTFGKYLSPINTFSDEKYLNEIRQFLQNIELKSIRKIGLLFCLKYQSSMQNNPDFIKTTNYFNNLNP